MILECKSNFKLGPTSRYRSKAVLLRKYFCRLYLMEEMAEEQWRSRFLHNAAQCSVASSKSKLGYLDTEKKSSIHEGLKKDKEKNIINSVVDHHRFDADPDPLLMPIKIQILIGIKTMRILVRILHPNSTHVAKSEFFYFQSQHCHFTVSYLSHHC